MIALAAPCCVTFLLPAYLGSAFRARTAILAMTLVFGAGVATVLLPITLGVAALSTLFSQYHGEVFILGGLMLVLLGFWSLAGKNFALPLHRSGSSDRTTVASVYSLGLFSGAASSCCAPVLVGVLTLSAISSSLPQATVLGLAYVTGMVSPLLLMALLWERFDFSNSLIVRGRVLRLGVSSLSWRVHSTNLLAGVLFLSVGVFVIVSTFLGGIETSQEQTQLGEYLRSAADTILRSTRGVPDFLFAILLGLALVYLLRRGLRQGVGRRFGPRRRVDTPGLYTASEDPAQRSEALAGAGLAGRLEGFDGE